MPVAPLVNKTELLVKFRAKRSGKNKKTALRAHRARRAVSISKARERRGAMYQQVLAVHEGGQAAGEELGHIGHVLGGINRFIGLAATRRSCE